MDANITTSLNSRAKTSLANLPVQDLQKEKDQAILILMNKIREHKAADAAGQQKKRSKKKEEKKRYAECRKGGEEVCRTAV